LADPAARAQPALERRPRDADGQLQPAAHRQQGAAGELQHLLGRPEDPAMKTATAALLLAACATPRYQDKAMDFAAVKAVAVLPFNNLSRDNLAGERVRDVFSNLLLATGAVYVLPAGEVARGWSRPTW